MTTTALTLPGVNLPAVSFCGICHRVLTDPHSIAAGIGPVCAGKHKDDAVPEHQPIIDPFDPASMDITCRRDARGQPIFNIPQRHVHHSPTGMEWGYHGSGPADFALNVLALFLPAPHVNPPGGVRCWDKSFVSQAAWDLHQEFKFDYVAKLPHAGGTIRGETIRQWIAVRLGEVTS